MKQVRFIPAEACNLQMREPQEGQQESREIEGRPIVFGVRSVNLTPWSSTRKVYEVLDPGCISRELLQKSDVVLNLNHSNMVPDVLGRYRNSEKDTLSLELRGDGIDCRCELPHDSLDDILEQFGDSVANTDVNEPAPVNVQVEVENKQPEPVEVPEEKPDAPQSVELAEGSLNSLKALVDEVKQNENDLIEKLHDEGGTSTEENALLDKKSITELANDISGAADAMNNQDNSPLQIRDPIFTIEPPTATIASAADLEKA